jgi:hypothetical protein
MVSDEAGSDESGLGGDPEALAAGGTPYAQLYGLVTTEVDDLSQGTYVFPVLVCLFSFLCVVSALCHTQRVLVGI